jgi:hypothetical protein
MMQMLASAGVPLLADDTRAPNADNPRGYFEFAPVKAIARDDSWLPLARGRVVKVVAPLLKHLGERERYRAIWMQRSLDEVLASQARMLEHSGREPSADDEALLRRAFEAQLEAARATLERRATPILFVSYAEAVAEPDRIATEVCAFVGGDLDIEAAASVVSPSLYRNRSLC